MIRIRLFGTLEVSHDEQLVRRPPTARVLSLLGYLIVNRGTPQHREKLVDLLWPDSDPRQGRRLLSDALWRARRLLAADEDSPTALLEVVGDSVIFQPSAEVWIDVIAFEQLAAAADLAALSEALSLYRADLLEECYDDWALYERERLRERYLALLGQLLEGYQQHGDYEAALQVALRLAHNDPLREEGQRELMRLYYRLDRLSEALRVYEQLRNQLADELASEPSPATTALYEEILALRTATGGSPVAAPADQAEMPILQGERLAFVGRHTERALLLHAVEAACGGKGGIVMVSGDPGQGKSRLLHEVAVGAGWREAQVSLGYGRRDAQAVPFGPLREALAEALTPLRVQQLAALLDPRWLGELSDLLPQLRAALPGLVLPAPLPPQRRRDQLHAALVETLTALSRIAPQVLILEDMHWFDTATLEAIGALVPHLPQSALLLVVSGRADELRSRPECWELLLACDRAGDLRRVELAGIREQETAELVRRALRLSQPAPRFSARLHAASGGNPFFVLEILRDLYEQGLLQRDEHGAWHTPLDAPDTDYGALALPNELRQAISSRLAQLSTNEREALAAAAVLGPQFSPAVWARMAGNQQSALGLDAPATVAQPPSELLRRRFLVEDHEGYRFSHDMLREVVYSGLDEAERHRLHLQAAVALEREQFARAEALAQHLYLAGAWEKALPYLVQVGDRAVELCAFADALRYYSQAMVAFEHSNAAPIALGWAAQLKRGEILGLSGSYAEAEAAYLTVLELAEQDAHLADAPARRGVRRSAQIQALNGICFIHGQQNHYAEALAASQRALELSAASARPLDRADALLHAGVLGYRRHDYGQAEQQLSQALEIFEELGTPETLARQARCLDALTWCRQRREGTTAAVLDSQQRALAIYRELNDRYGEQECLLSLSNLYLIKGACAQAIAACNAALAVFREARTRDKIAECQFVRGTALCRSGQLEEGLVALDEALTICRELGRSAAAQFTELHRGQALRGLGRRGEARQLLEQTACSDDSLIRARAKVALAELDLDERRLEAAFDHASQAQEALRRLESAPNLGRALRVLGQVRAADQQAILPAASPEAPDAAQCFRESATLLEMAGYDGDLGSTLLHYGIWLRDQHQDSEATVVVRRALTLLGESGMQPELDLAQAAIQQLAEQPQAIPGHRQVTLARHNAPQGRPLRPDELIRVIWTVEAAEDDLELERGGKVAQRQTRLRRLCAEANAQGAEPTVADLADALGVTTRTVSRDLAALRAAGEPLATRGS